jgi:hypothetical protein
VKGDPELVLVGGFGLQKKSHNLGDYLVVHPDGFELGMAQRMVLHQELGGDAIPGAHGDASCEEGELDVGAPYSREGAHGGSSRRRCGTML